MTDDTTDTTETCDRCGTAIDGVETDAGTAGFYRTHDGTPWAQYTDADEDVVCDPCMLTDPRYQADYGTANVTDTDYERAAARQDRPVEDLKNA